MPKLQVSVSPQLHSQLKAEAKSRGMYFGHYVSEILEATFTRPKPKASSQTKALVITNPEVQEVIDHFEKNIAKVRGLTQAKRAAGQLIADHGFERVIGAINAVKLSQGMEFAPVIASLPTLQEKWVNLEHFVKRTTRQRSLGVIR